MKYFCDIGKNDICCRGDEQSRDLGLTLEYPENFCYFLPSRCSGGITNILGWPLTFYLTLSYDENLNNHATQYKQNLNIRISFASLTIILVHCVLAFWQVWSCCETVEWRLNILRISWVYHEYILYSILVAWVYLEYIFWKVLSCCETVRGAKIEYWPTNSIQSTRRQ